MDHSLLLNSNSSAVAEYLRASAARLGTGAVTKDLLSRVDEESLPPRVFNLWLSAGGDDDAIHQGLYFQQSQAVRRASIAHFGKEFRSRRFEEVWLVVGGIEGIIGYLETASVCDVKLFCSQIRRSATTETSAEPRKALIDGLYQALRDLGSSEADMVNSDRRPLSSLYHIIFPACSQSLVISAVDTRSGIVDIGNGESAFHAHTALFRSRCLAELKDPSRDVDMQQIRTLLSIDSNEETTLQDDRVSGNMQFSLEVLDALSYKVTSQLKEDPAALLSEIATPLFRRLSRRQCQSETVAKAAWAYFGYVQHHISNHMSLTDIYNGPGLFLIKNWGRCPDLLESSLATLMRLVRKQKLSIPLALVKLVPRAVRTRLLSMVSGCDLTSEEGLKRSQLQWDSSILLALPRIEARQILERLIETGGKSLNEYYAANQRHAESDLLMIKLSKDEPNLLEMATTAVDDRKKDANRAREQPDRTVCISYALQTAIASRNLQLYRETLLWTRRYLKDPLTAIQIFQGPSFHSDECLDLLCGFAKEQRDCASLTRDQVATDVRMANMIITECLETACKAQREPGFQSYHWRSVLGLMGKVFRERYARVNALQDALRLSDNHVFETVWQDTLDACKNIETIGLDDDNSDLDFRSLGGPLMRDGSVLPVLTKPRPAIFRFLDLHAKARNDMWEVYRRKSVPATLTIVDPYPRGLPLDCLIPVNLKQCQSGKHLPYLFTRAETAVFVPAEIALATTPDSDDEASAIGPFVENWHAALKNYVYMSQSRPEAALAAWKYATGSLSETRMSPTEAHLFWSPVFTKSLKDTDVQGPWELPLAEPQPPRIPSADEGEQPTEWSPETDVKSLEVKNRRLQPTRIDAMLHMIWSAGRDISDSNMLDVSSEIPPRSLNSFWARWRNPWGASGATREALVAAALLHVSETNTLSPGVLSKPFPEGMSVRFPALYLDSDFLETQDPKRKGSFVWGPLMRLSGDVPATLLLRLTKALIDAAANKEQAPTDVLQLLRVLIDGDRPQVALELIQHIVLERPDESSWQRLVLTEGLLNSLSKQTVETFLRGLSSAMQKRLSEQNSGKEQNNRKDDTTSSQGPRPIKITTVKMICQLLAGSKFIGQKFASSTLIRLLSSSRHIDIQISAVESLVGFLASSDDASLCDDIISALETHCVPIMSGLDERQALSWDDLMSYDSKNLPELQRLSWGDLPSLLSCMLSSVGRVPENIRQQLFDRVLITSLMKNCDIHRRWLHVFIQQQMGLVPIESLPRAPTQMRFLFELLKWPAHCPSLVLDMWLDALTTILKPPRGIEEMHQRVSENPKVANSTNGQHWHAFWCESKKYMLTQRIKPASILSQQWQPFKQDGLDIGYVQDIVRKQADLVLPLLGTTVEFRLWTSFVGDLEPPELSSNKLDLWHRNCKPVIDSVLDKVNSHRTIDWFGNPDRSPPTLPDTFAQKVWLLTPAFESAEARDYDGIAGFAASVKDTLAEIVNTRRAYLEQYQTFKNFVLTKVTTIGRINLAVILGEVYGQARSNAGAMSARDDLAVDLVKHLLKSTVRFAAGEELQAKVISMVHGLVTHYDEGIRNVGFTIRQDWDPRNLEKAWYARESAVGNV